MIRRFNDFSFIDDESLQKIADVVNNQKKLIKIFNDKKRALIAAKELRFQGYNVTVESKDEEYYIYVVPREKILLKDAKNSGQFTKVAFDRYAFSNKKNIEAELTNQASLTLQANNPLGIKHYNFDEGTIWKVVAGKDGKEYLVKEIDDKDEDKIIRQPSEKAFQSTVLASSKANPKQLVKLCKVLYNNPDEDFINDLVKYSSKSLTEILNNKLNRVVTAELEQFNVTSPAHGNAMKEKIIQAINNNQIYNRQQISNLISKSMTY